MKKTSAFLALTCSLSSVAMAKDLTLGEMSTGATIEGNDILITPFFAPTKVGLRDNLEAITCLICNAVVGNAGLRYNLRRDEERTMALTGWLGYQYPTEDETGTPMSGAPFLYTGFDYSVLAKDNWLTVNLSAGVRSEGGEVMIDGSSVGLNYLLLNGDKAWEFGLWTDPYAVSQGSDPIDALGLDASWKKTMGIIRFGFGIAVTGTEGFKANSPLGQLTVFSDYALPIVVAPTGSFAARF